jgi:hypothetical protein
VVQLGASAIQRGESGGQPVSAQDLGSGEVAQVLGHHNQERQPRISFLRGNRLVHGPLERRKSGGDQLRRHLADFGAAYNFGRRLKTLKGLTPYECICKAWASQPERFTLNPLQQMPGLNI